MNATKTEGHKLRARYWDESLQVCEIAFELGLHLERDPVGAPVIRRYCTGLRWPASTTHEIFSCGTRPMTIGNMLNISDVAHWLVHNGKRGEPVVVRMLCMLSKIRKAERTGNPREWSREELHAASGMWPEGWVEKAVIPDCWEPQRRELLRRIESTRLSDMRVRQFPQSEESKT